MKKKCSDKFFNRKARSIYCANIILQYGLFNDFRVFCYTHPKIKSQFRLANLFLLNKKLRYASLDSLISEVNCSNLLDYYYA